MPVIVPRGVREKIISKKEGRKEGKDSPVSEATVKDGGEEEESRSCPDDECFLLQKKTRKK